MSVNKTFGLEWDSIFFGFNVAKIEFEHLQYLENQIEQGYANGIKLIYGLTKNVKVPNHILNKYNGELVDVKVGFVKNLKQLQTIDDIIEPLIIKDGDIEQLYKLGFQSGSYSRFKLDKKLPESSFERLYRLWIDHAVNGEFSDFVFVYRVNSRIEGFITLSIKEKLGEIGLIAVSDNLRGKKIGSKLLAKVENLLIEKEINQMKVATQLNNKLACKFYEKNEYFVDSKIRIYHFHNK